MTAISSWLGQLRRYRNEYLAAITGTLSIFMVVCTNAWSSPAMPKLLAEPDPPVSITPDAGSWIVSIQSIGGIFGMIIAGLTVDRFGRKWPFIGSAFPIIAGWTMIALARAPLLLYVARFLFGVSYGIAYGIAPIYIGEIASDRVRGATASFITMMAKLAILFEYSVGPYASFETLAWLGLPGAALFLCTFVWMPESPHYLLGKGRSDEAHRCLRWLRRHSEVEDELAATKRSAERAASEGTSMGDLFQPRYRNNLIIVFILGVGINLTGMQAILSYAQTIFAGISSDLTQAEMSIVLGAVQMLTVLFPVFFVDRLGRRPLMLWSSAISTLGMLMGAIYFTLDAADVAVKPYGWVSFVGLVVFVVSYAFGLATVPFSILSEIFPKNIRAYANALFGILSGVVIFGVVKLFQVAIDNVGAYLPFWVFTVSAALTFVFVFLYIPETKGRSLDEVQDIIARWRTGKENKVPKIVVTVVE
ncbi:facilitated trehalose transporter Tret1-like [Anopheles ziemanni]|uniref:facilitated trehalose transporter Tret1-like n=1 Tax=Anopheles coustani TaxID=139045 RepID=UPI00265835B9|nr:facilitated trehalose transporter Tret1-like [Anopheles coustani]XP_058177323.1 facilitated trehalose transporter Tret1-like [Anopheles ziemanni]